MTVYLVILEDRHIDVQIEVFADKDMAKIRFKEIINDYKIWMFEHHLTYEAFARLGGEGDCVSIQSKEVK